MEAKAAAHVLNLDNGVVEATNVSDFSAKPGVAGPIAEIVFGRRYRFWTQGGCFLGFADLRYCWPSYSGAYFTEGGDKTGANNIRKQANLVGEWAQERDRLDIRKAENIADRTLRASGAPIAAMKLGRPEVEKQISWKLPNDKDCLLPYYTFDWKPNGLKEGEWCKIDVSGITSKIVFFSCGSSYYPNLPKNYLELLGVATNSVFVTPAGPLGQAGPLYKLYPNPVPIPAGPPSLDFFR